MLSSQTSRLCPSLRILAGTGCRRYARSAPPRGDVRPAVSVIPQTEPGKEEAVVLSNDGDMFVCWHPQETIPYSCTRPLPEVPETDTVLNVQYDKEAKEIFKRQHPYYVMEKLKGLTYTTKHKWYPKSFRSTMRDEGPKLPKDREYL